MKLKRLDIHGFKSFYHRTSVVFDDGITGVVGPNGCGKSNIVDAIKWVMGEQGAKSLRGSSMEDVIFNGSAQRKSMGMCDVRLTFENDGTAAVPALWSEVTEIAIERRLERSKGSDYLINQKRCRLADVHDLIAGTGVGGRRAYAIIEQGQISRIVSARADERRLLIEEAAGISRYRVRRRLAERKMLETEQNLERVDDIIGELERQLRSLRRQAKKAERFREYRDESREIALRVSLFEFRALRTELSEQSSLVTALTNAEADGVVAVQAAEANRSATQLKAREAAEAVNTLAVELRQFEERALLARERLTGHVREKDMLNAQLARAQQDLESGEGRRGELQAEREETTARLSQAEAEAEREAEELAKREMEKSEAVRALLDARAATESLVRQEAQEVQAMARARADLDYAMTRQSELASRRVRLTNQNADLVERLEAHSKTLAEAQALAEEAGATLGEARTHHQEGVEKLTAARQALEVAVDEERALRVRIVEARSRRESLVEVERRREELGDGARMLIEAEISGALGAVAEILDVPEDLEKAVLAGLGARIDGVLVQGAAAHDAGMAQLRELGARGLIAQSDVAPKERTADVPGLDGVEGYLADLLQAGAYHAVITHLLDDALLVRDLETARALLATGWSGSVVTRTGDRIDHGSLFTVGQATQDAGPIGRRREIKELGEAVTVMADAHQGLETRLIHLKTEQDEARLGLDEARLALQNAEIQANAVRKDAEQLTRDHDRAQQAASRYAAELGLIDEQVAESKTNEIAARASLEEAEAGRVDRRNAMSDAEEAARAAEANRDAAVSAVHQAKARAMGRSERLLTLRTLLSRLTRQIDEIEVRKEKVVSVGADVERRLVELEVETANDRQVAETAERRAEDLAGGLVALRVDSQNLEDAVMKADETLETLRRKRDDLRQRQSESRLELESIKLKQSALVERVRERHQVELDSIASAQLEEEAPTADELERLSELEALLERMGDVNLAAIEEFEAVEERHQFLSAQREDLLSALADLEQAIAEIDRTSKELFETTFAAVDGHFRALFPRLFRGGEARLSLTDPDNLLETGIEMHVSPPGKRVQSVELLSGGEKAMCAIALVFAVFRHRPSPFCLLDEVDAPLDDANIARFNEVVREIAQTSQVVLVTHNKRTMEIADALYGVTMEESGVSKLVSVRMT